MEDEGSKNQYTGLSKEQVLLSAQKSGTNKLNFKKDNPIIHSLKSLLKELKDYTKVCKLISNL